MHEIRERWVSHCEEVCGAWAWIRVISEKQNTNSHLHSIHFLVSSQSFICVTPDCSLHLGLQMVLTPQLIPVSLRFICSFFWFFASFCRYNNEEEKHDTISIFKDLGRFINADRNLFMVSGDISQLVLFLNFWLFERRNGEREVRNREVSHPLVNCPGVYMSQLWTRLKPAARSSFLVPT